MNKGMNQRLEKKNEDNSSSANIQHRRDRNWWLMAVFHIKKKKKTK